MARTKAQKQSQKKDNIAKEILTNGYRCSCCGNVYTEKKIASAFYMSSSELYRSIFQNRITICKDCIINIYNEFVVSTNDVRLATMLTCQKTDFYWSESAFEGALIESKKGNSIIIKTYITKMNSLKQYKGKTFSDYLLEKPDEDLKGVILENQNEILSNQEIDIEEQELLDEYKMFWGEIKDCDLFDYQFLEQELNDWKKTHKCDNKSELTLLKEICYKELELRKRRFEGDDVGKLQKDLQDLMKTASVDPAKANAISDSQTVDRFGVWLKDIEQRRPAEWHNEQERYVDMDGFKKYIKNYIVRPIKNFFTGNKDFMIDGEDLGFKDNE